MTTPDDHDLHVRRDGPPDAAALLLIHGSAATSRSWDWLTPLLAVRHHVIRIDLPGCGDSAPPADNDFSVVAGARRVAETMDRLGVVPAVVVGHSSGGMVATALAEHRADLVPALALINTGPRLTAYLAAEAGTVQPAPAAPTDDQLRRLAGTGFGPGFAIPEQLLAEFRRMSHHAIAATMQGASAYLEQRALPDRLRGLGRPLLVIFGADDLRWDSASAADYGVVPGARIELLPGIGHTPIIEDPQRTARLLLDFTARC